MIPSISSSNKFLFTRVIAGLGLHAAAKTLSMPPQPNPLGQKQPVFGNANGYFTFDGKPDVIISGSHYHRVPRTPVQAKDCLAD